MNLDDQDLNVLRVLAEARGPLSTSRLMRETGHRSSQVMRNKLSRLIREGYAIEEREGRASWITITQSGRDAYTGTPSPSPVEQDDEGGSEGSNGGSGIGTVDGNRPLTRDSE